MEAASERPQNGGPTKERRWKPAVGLLIALVLPFVRLGAWIAPGQTLPALLSRELIWWSYAAIVVAWLLLVERKPLASIGFRGPTWRTFAFAVLAAICLIAILISEYALIVPLFHVHGDAAAEVRAGIMKTPYWYRVMMVLRAAVVEEVLFRAYLMEKVRELSGRWSVAVGVSVVAFTLAHLSGWGLLHLIPVFGAAVVFALLYWWRRDTPSNMIAHFLTDAGGFLMA